MKIIGVAGKKNSGKDTFADFAREGWGFVRYAFADELKLHIHILDPYIKTGWFSYRKLSSILSEMSETEAKNRYKDLRRFYQAYGTDVWRERNPDIWVDALFRIVDNHVDENVVITDVRFQNEIDAIKKRGGYLVKIKRPVATDELSSHVSEQDLPDELFDYIIENDSDLFWFYDKVEEVLEKIIPESKEEVE